MIIAIVFVLAIVIGYWYYRKKKLEKYKRNKNNEINLDSISGSTSSIRYTFDDIKQATRNFAIDNIIGRGGFGNVFKGVALKRFKNRSAVGDTSFMHEVEVIASVFHVNLVARLYSV